MESEQIREFTYDILWNDLSNLGLCGFVLAQGVKLQCP